MSRGFHLSWLYPHAGAWALYGGASEQSRRAGRFNCRRLKLCLLAAGGFGRRCSREPAAIGKAWVMNGLSYFACDELDDLSVGKCSVPAGKMVFLGFIPVLLQFVEAQDQISQGGHGKGAVTSADGRGVLSQTDIPAIMRSVFTGRPVVANNLEQLCGGVLRL